MAYTDRVRANGLTISAAVAHYPVETSKESGWVKKILIAR